MPTNKGDFKPGLPYKLAGQLFAGKTYHCAWCGHVVEGFKDRLSAAEFRATGICQICQDKIFPDPEKGQSQ